MPMTIEDIMNKDPVIVSEQTTLRQAARKMAAQNLGMLLVGKPTRVSGVITDRDLVVRGLADALNPDQVTLGSLIDHPPVTCQKYKSVEEAVSIMEECKIRRLLITDEKTLPVGVLSIDDIAVRCPNERLVARALHQIAKDVAVPVS